MHQVSCDNSNIILCVPGQWKDRSELVASLVKFNKGEYLYAGNVLMHVPTNENFEIEFCGHDDRMKTSFEVASAWQLSLEELDAIDRHTYVIYIVGKGGDMRSASNIMKAACAFLNAGGLGVKVETSGKAFSASSWSTLAGIDLERAYYRAFVILLSSEEDKQIYTCGMHNLGLRDTICDNKGDVASISELIEIFALYQLVEKPVIKDGQTFSPQEGGAVYRIIEGACTFYDRTELFYNPFGMYYLKDVLLAT